MKIVQGSEDIMLKVPKMGTGGLHGDTYILKAGINKAKQI